jgi:hypothetical protein
MKKHLEHEQQNEGAAASIFQKVTIFIVLRFVPRPCVSVFKGGDKWKLHAACRGISISMCHQYTPNPTWSSIVYNMPMSPVSIREPTFIVLLVFL